MLILEACSRVFVNTREVRFGAHGVLVVLVWPWFESSWFAGISMIMVQSLARQWYVHALMPLEECSWSSVRVGVGVSDSQRRERGRCF